ncbi:hypothetical protein [Deinococcus radiophilus]|uniref:Uncharacterized protein n=1 Tax=Deinococcus radiophilus TaxID=32062 RepID=A0A3S0JR95_9DEIO|nr:hypothetical protein [Deinococcus radiophilus]RTR27278.1 hypothetical protein EJ104_06905 [Deinococcus radiophilus]UFA50638.1 hypothetical protein LMT64_01625 [Deinococcus radiophilus]
MTDANDRNINIGEDVNVDDTKPEIIEEKLENEDILREGQRENMQNPNDEPGFADGREGDWDGEDRQGDPNSLTGSDLEGEAEGGAGVGSGGGIDGGPARR